jgi:hypothetical protein
MNQITFLKQLFFFLKQSEYCYQQYLSNGKKFIYAIAIRNVNSQLKDLIISNGYLLDQSLQNDLISLAFHLDIWIVKWDAHQKELNPRFDQLFVFENEVNFPKKAYQNLESEYLKIVN